jgi:hypothetical protein
VTQVQRLIHALFVGASLGALDGEALAAVDADYYARQREPVGDRTLPYDDPGHIFSGFVPWEAQAITEHFPAGGRILITGAGAGREVAAARDLGFAPQGYEPNADLRRAGDAAFARRGWADRLLPCPRDAFPTAARSADGVIIGWGSFSHVAGHGRRVAFLRAARATLAPGAPLLVSYWSLPSAVRYQRVVWAVSRAVRRLRRREATELGDILAPLFLHCFTPAEIHRELELASFEIVVTALEPYPHTIAQAV